MPGVQLIEEIGRGASTVVYRARRGDRRYAVTLLRTAGDEREAAAFRREAALLASVNHRRSARIHEVGQLDGRPYLVMDLIEGYSLARTLRAGPLPEDRAVELAAQLAEALAAAHRVGLVHRDVKPENIMIRPDGQATLIDYSLATRTGCIASDPAVGTFRYSAPEQTGMLRRAVDGRADLYALGVVMFQCLTGTPPFTATDVGELIQSHLTVPAPDLRAARPQLSPAVAAVVGKLLAKDPDDRYQSGDGLRADLELIAAGRRGVFPLGTGDVRPGEGCRLVGRVEQRTRLLSRWREAAAGRGGIALVQGPAGAGKSRLARDLAATVRAAGQPVYAGRCSAGDAPLAALRQAVRKHLDAPSPEAGPDRLDQLRRAAAVSVGNLDGRGADLLRGFLPELARVPLEPAAAGSQPEADPDPNRFAEVPPGPIRRRRA